MVSVTQERVRPMSVEQLGLNVSKSPGAPLAHTPDENEVLPLEENHSLMVDVRAALSMDYAGVIFSGPPGTGKSYFAERVAHTLASDPTAVHPVQFHASYQYEDFMQGVAPTEDGSGFELQNKVFALACRAAEQDQNSTHVILIEEISRCDVARVFGEALTYLEPYKRGKKFLLASGKELRVPSNLIILATMNPWDKGVDELDVALERRFAQIDMPPSSDALRQILSGRATPDFINRLVSFFDAVQALDDDMLHLGHAYFKDCVDETSARRAWAFRLSPFFAKACKLDKRTLRTINQLWATVLVAPPEAANSDNGGIAAEGDGAVTANAPPAGNT